MSPTADVLVVGTGPAGLAAAAACAGRGMAVTVVGPDHDAAWPNTYGVWTDEVSAAGLDDVTRVSWPEVRVVTGDGPADLRVLPRGYGLIDNERLRRGLQEAAVRAGARLVTGNALGVRRTGAGLEVTVGAAGEGPGRGQVARAVVDASGHRPALLRRGRSSGPVAWQAAYGILGTFTAPPVEPGSMVFMDYRAAPLEGLEGVGRDPTFLYAMDLGDGRFFVEETSLARRPALGFDVLAGRLARRLERAGATPVETHEVERCLFPMGVPLPPRDQLVIGFGGAAGMVHPATGYQVGSALTRAPALADALAAALDDAGATPRSVARAGWSAVWPDALVRQRALHLFGLEALLRFDTPTIQRFFSAFFALDEHRWRGFVSGADTFRSVSATMLGLFAEASPGLRRALVRPALGRAGAGLARAAVAPGRA